MHPLFVTMAAAALLGLLGAFLAGRVIRARGQTKISLGHEAPGSVGFGEENSAPPLFVAQRAHLNFCEYAPMGLILLGLSEAAGASRLVCLGLAAMLVVGRVLHPFGLGRRAPNPFRAGGVALTILEMVGASAYLLYATVRG